MIYSSSLDSVGYQWVLWQGGMSDKWLRRRLSHDADFACAIHSTSGLIRLPFPLRLPFSVQTAPLSSHLVYFSLSFDFSGLAAGLLEQDCLSSLIISSQFILGGTTSAGTGFELLTMKGRPNFLPSIVPL